MRRALVLLSTAAVVCALAGCNAEGDATKTKTVPRPVLSVVVKPQEDQDVGFAGTIDQTAAGRRRSRLDCRDGADEGDGEAGPERRQHQRRGGIAGDHREVGVKARDEALHDGEDAGDELLLAQAAIGETGVVGGVDDMRRRAGTRGASEHGETAEPGIEDEDGGLGAGGHKRAITRSGEKIDLHDYAAKRQSPIPPESR